MITFRTLRSRRGASQEQRQKVWFLTIEQLGVKSDQTTIVLMRAQGNPKQGACTCSFALCKNQFLDLGVCAMRTVVCVAENSVVQAICIQDTLPFLSVLKTFDDLW